MKRLLVPIVCLALSCGSKSSSSGSASASASAAPSSAPPPGRSTLAVIRMADELDLFPEESAQLPKGGSLLNESVPVGTQRKVLPKEVAAEICGAKVEGGAPPVHCDKVGDDMTVNVPVGVAHNYLRVVPVDGETVDAAIARSEPFFKTLSLPPDAKIMVGKLLEPDDKTKKNVAVGFRTYVVSGVPVLTEKDIQSAKADDTGGAAAVTLSLTPEGSTRFEQFTGDNVMHRLAFVVDGNVLSAPVVQSKIGGGHLSIALSAAEKGTDADKAEAERLAKALSRP